MLRRDSRRAGERGQAIIMITLSLLMLMGMLGLVIDLGWSHYTLQVAQSAADSGAMAAALAAKTVNTWSCGSLGCATTAADCSSVSTTSPLYAACEYANTNGFSSGGSGGKQTVKVQANVTSTPPNSTVTANYWVKVTVTQSMPQLFSAVLGNTTGMVAATSTAAVLGSSGGSGGCVYVLDPTGSGSLFDTGQGTLNASCGIKIASTSSSAVHVNGCSHVIGGPITIGGSYKIDDTSCSTVVGTPLTTNQSGCCANPLSNEPIPSAVTNKQNCDHTSQFYVDQNSNNNATLTPGVYCGGIMINGGTATFSSGTYILNGGGLTIQNNSSVTGTAVTFFNTAYKTTNNAYTGSYGRFMFSDSIVKINFSAPTSGQFDGMLLYQDPSIPVGSAGSQIQAKAATVLQGTIYLPTTSLTYTGEASTAEVVGMVVYDLTMNGNSSFTINTDTDGSKTGLGGGTTTVSMLM